MEIFFIKKVMKILDSMVLALVVPAYKGLVETTEKMKEPLEKTFNEMKDEIVSVQKKISAQLIGMNQEKDIILFPSRFHAWFKPGRLYISA